MPAPPVNTAISASDREYPSFLCFAHPAFFVCIIGLYELSRPFVISDKTMKRTLWEISDRHKSLEDLVPAFVALWALLRYRRRRREQNEHCLSPFPSNQAWLTLDGIRVWPCLLKHYRFFFVWYLAPVVIGAAHTAYAV